VAQINFNAAEVPPQESITPIPAGVYLAQAVESDVVPTKSGGQMAKFTFQVLQGPYANRKVFANINIRNANQDAERIGQSQLSALCHAVGLVGQLNDTAQLHLRPVMIRVKIRKDDTGQYGDRNEVTGYEAAQTPAQGAGGATFPPSRPPAAPAAAHTFAATVPPTAPAGAAFEQPQQATATVGSAPWARRAAPAAQA